MKELTKDQKILLLYLECMAVEGGIVDMGRMNSDDMRQAILWNDIGFIGFGRICAGDIRRGGSHWVQLTEASWQVAAFLRRSRAASLFDKRTFQTTAEKQATP